jgi:hypothetical protein
MFYYILKIIISAVLIVVISEISKRSSFWGGILASIPLVSVIAIIWLYIETKDLQKISDLSINIFWLVIPSLSLFITLPMFLKMKLNFFPALVLSIILMVILYFFMISLLKHFGIKI